MRTTSGIDSASAGGVITVAALAVTVFIAAATGITASRVSWFAHFDRTRSELPESIAIDKHGNIYVSLSPTGEVRRIAPDGTESTLAVLGSGPRPRFLLGLAVGPPPEERDRNDADEHDRERADDIYALLNDMPPNRGVWRISPLGTTLFAPIPAAGLLNALAFDDRGYLYASDSFLATIYRVSRDGAAEPWLTDPLLQGNAEGPCGQFPFGVRGANGVAFNKGSLYVLNTNQGSVVRIPIAPDGRPEPAQLLAGPTCELWGADGQAFDVHDNLYVAVNIQNKIVRVDPRGDIDTVASAPADPLFFPSAIAFGTRRGERKRMFITNFAAPGGMPGIVMMDVSVPGRRLP